MHPLLFVHIAGAIVGLLAGFMAMLARKRSGGVHQIAGTIFYGAMIAMNASAIYLAIFHKPNRMNVIAGSLTLYLVLTAWRAARRRDGAIGWFDRGAALVIFFVGLLAFSFGFAATNAPKGQLDGMPAPGYFFFGLMVFRCAYSDLRVLLAGGVRGAQRISRHLWRMCGALMIVTGSLYPGQARIFPAEWRGNPLIYVPHLFLLCSWIFWAVRMRMNRRRERQSAAAIAPQAVTRLAA